MKDITQLRLLFLVCVIACFVVTITLLTTLPGVKETFQIWNTRTVSDGMYEVRVVATDIKGNPPGIEPWHSPAPPL